MGGDLGSLLRNLRIFSSLDEASLQTLVQSCRRRRFRAKETLFHHGDPGQTLYVIVSGQINIERVTASGETIHIAQRGPGEQVGEMALLDGMPRSANAVTDTPCELLMLDRTAFLGCLERSPQMALTILGSLAARLREASDQLENYRVLDVLGRLSAFLLEAAESQGIADPAGGKRLSAKITQQEMAERIGTTRETVNRALARLKESGVLRPSDGYWVVVDFKKLNRYAAREENQG